MNRFTKRLSLVSLMVVVASAPLAQAQPHSTDATVKFSGHSIGVGAGYTWGSGVLYFQGKSYPFAVDGLSVADIGVANIEGVGEVYNLHGIQDFPGKYVAAGAGATLASGGSMAALENEKGVIVHFHSNTQGLQLNLSASGIMVSLNP